jgi:hypothetical protein
MFQALVMMVIVLVMVMVMGVEWFDPLQVADVVFVWCV